MPLAFRVQAWHPCRWQHWAVNILDTTSRGADLKFSQTLLTLPVKSHCLCLISSSSLRSLEVRFPNCFTVSFQCRTVPFSYITGGFREPCLPANRTHTVFLALKIMSYSTLNSSHIFNIRLKLNTVGVSKARSSAEHKDPKYSWPMWQPTPLLSNLSNRTSISRVKMMGDKTPPCLTPFDVLNDEEYCPFYTVLTFCLLYMSNTSLIAHDGIFLAIMISKSISNFTRSKATTGEKRTNDLSHSKSHNMFCVSK